MSDWLPVRKPQFRTGYQSENPFSDWLPVRKPQFRTGYQSENQPKKKCFSDWFSDWLLRFSDWSSDW